MFHFEGDPKEMKSAEEHMQREREQERATALRATLHAYSPEADKLLNALADMHLSNADFSAKIADYNARHTRETPPKGRHEQFTFEAGGGRMVVVSLYEDGHVVLIGSTGNTRQNR